MQLLLAHLRTHTTAARAPSLNTLQFPRARGCVVMMQLKLVSCAWVFNTWLLDCPYFWIFICAGLGPELQSQISRLKAEHSNYTFFCCDFFFFFSFLHSATKVGKTYLYIYIFDFFSFNVILKTFLAQSIGTKNNNDALKMLKHKKALKGQEKRILQFCVVSKNVRKYYSKCGAHLAKRSVLGVCIWQYHT